MTINERLASIESKLSTLIGVTETRRESHDEKHDVIDEKLISIVKVQDDHTDTFSQQKGMYKLLMIIAGFVTFVTAAAVGYFTTKPPI